MSAVQKKSVKAPKLGNGPSTIRRHSAPNQYDHWPKGTSMIVAEKEIYIQTSQDDNSPCWVLMGPYNPSPAL